MKDMKIGVKLVKNVSQIHGASVKGYLKFRKRLKRASARVDCRL